MLGNDINEIQFHGEIHLLHVLMPQHLVDCKGVDSSKVVQIEE